MDPFEREGHIASSPARSKLLRLVRERPALGAAEAARAIALGWGAFEHHLRRLEHEGHLRIVKAGGRALLFPAPRRVPSHDALAVLASRGTVLRVARAIMEEPGASVAQVRARACVSRRAAYYHVKRLMDAGLVRSGGYRSLDALYPTGALEPLVRLLGGEEFFRGQNTTIEKEGGVSCG